jgi:YhcH/YjgK/YiaL family protein
MSSILKSLGTPSPRRDLSKDLSHMKDEDIIKWFNARDWTSGWNVDPDESINKRELAVQFHKNRKHWEQAFLFLKNTDLEKSSVGKYELDGEELYAMIDEYKTRNEEDVMYEAHKVYADIQYLVYGEERIGVIDSTCSREVIPYDKTRDIAFLKSEKNNYRLASSKVFFVFFPKDAHRPCVKINDNSPVRKVVIKIKVH